MGPNYCRHHRGPRPSLTMRKSVTHYVLRPPPTAPFECTVGHLTTTNTTTANIMLKDARKPRAMTRAEAETGLCVPGGGPFLLHSGGSSDRTSLPFPSAGGLVLAPQDSQWKKSPTGPTFPLATASLQVSVGPPVLFVPLDCRAGTLRVRVRC
jgi:hypothetical protein